MPLKHIAIIGGGLSGLTLAYFLKKNAITATIIEADTRLGGRIHTQQGQLHTPLELGATWFSSAHQNLLQLIEELGLSTYPQFSEGKSLFQTKSMEPPQEFYVPASEAPSFRLKDGTAALINALSQELSKDHVHLNTRVTSITQDHDGLRIDTNSGDSFKADKVVICMPPQLAGSSISFSPELPEALSSLLPSVQTWMAGSIKFTLEYAEPFWRHQGYSGMLFSHVGIVTEMYDHTNFEETKFGFTGFLHGAASRYTQEERKAYVLQQLSMLLGAEASKPVAYYDKVWDNQLILGNNELVPKPHYNNGHPLLKEPYMNGQLWFAGTETSIEHPGYMEGAVCSARESLLKLINE